MARQIADEGDVEYSVHSGHSLERSDSNETGHTPKPSTPLASIPEVSRTPTECEDDWGHNIDTEHESETSLERKRVFGSLNMSNSQEGEPAQMQLRERRHSLSDDIKGKWNTKWTAF